MSRIDLNDPRLTAYALDEMPAAERSAFEAELRADPAAQVAVDEIRQTAAAIADALEFEPVPERVIEPPLPQRRRTRSLWSAIPWTLWAPLAAAACFALVYTLRRPVGIRPENTGTLVAQNPPAAAPGVTAREAPSQPAAQPVPEVSAPVAAVAPANAGPVSPPRAIAELAEAPTRADNVTTAPPRALQPDPDSVVLSPFVSSPSRTPATPSPSHATTARNDRGTTTPGPGSDRSADWARARAAYENAGNTRPPSPVTPRSSLDAPTQPAGRPSPRLLDVDLPPVPDGWPRGTPHTVTNPADDADLSPNAFRAAAQHPLATVPTDSGGGAYASVRRSLLGGQRPPVSRVRIEELVNAFTYAYPVPTDPAPLGVYPELHASPWAADHLLLRVGLQGRPAAIADRPATNLVFLVDGSGSMAAPTKLPLLREALRSLADRLRPQDRIAIAVYAGAGGTVLPPTPGSHRAEILAALEQLTASGSTHPGPGLQLAYDLAAAGFIPDGANRVLLCTDGDFNLGVPNPAGLFGFIAAKAQAGINLTTLGFGLGGSRDSTLERLAVTGAGRCGYVDSVREARQLLVEQAGAPVPVLATELTLQVEFNPAKVAAYRMIGYEIHSAQPNGAGAPADSGMLGAGQTVTALFEIVPVGAKVDLPVAEPLRYQQPTAPAAAGDEWLTVKIRYKATGANASQALNVPVREAARTAAATADFKFAAAVAGFGLLLQDNPHKGAANWATVETLAREGSVGDTTSERAEFLSLVQKARELGAAK